MSDDAPFLVTVDEAEFARAPAAQARKLRALAKQLRDRPFLGNRIRREQFPKRFTRLPNLFRLELPDGWRALYTVATHPAARREIRIVFVGDPRRYDRLFGYPRLEGKSAQTMTR